MSINLSNPTISVDNLTIEKDGEAIQLTDAILKKDVQTNLSVFKTTSTDSTSTTYVDVSSSDIVSPATTLPNQKIRVDVQVEGHNLSAGICYVQIYDIDEDAEIAAFAIQDNYMRCVSFSGVSASIATAGNTKNIRLRQKSSTASYASRVSSFHIKCSLEDA